MISLNSEYICLLELLKASLFGLSPTIQKKINWDKLFESAKAQCVAPLIASYVPEEHRSKWLDVSFQSKAHYMQLMHEQNSLIELLNANRIPFVILKGTAAAIYYPIPSLRIFGDIDLYVSEEFFDSATKIFESNGYKYINQNDRHYEYIKNGIQFELHYKFSIEYYNDIDHIVLNGLHNSVVYNINNFSFPCLPTYENGLVLLGHIMQHLKYSGIGLRQIIDWMMFVHKELDDSSWETHFKALANEAGLEKLAITVTYMCKKWLGLPCDCTWCDSADEEVTDEILIRILDDGNLGFDRSIGDSVLNSLKREGFFKHLQRVGLANSQLCQKHIVFRPFAWLFQLFRYLFRGFIGFIKREKIFMKTKNQMSLEELWKRLE